MGKIKLFIDGIMIVVLFVQGVALLVLIGIEVFFRYVVGSALSWPEEVAGIVFVWFTLVGVSILVGENAHISFSFLDKYFPRLVSLSIKVMAHAIVILYGVIMVVYGYRYMVLFRYEVSPAAGINLMWLNSAIPFNGVLVAFYSLVNVIEETRRYFRGTK